MKENWLEDELQRRLSKKETSSDLDQLWQDLESRRHPQKKRRAIWIWFIPIILVLVTTFYLGYMNNVESEASDPFAKTEIILSDSLNSVMNGNKVIIINESNESNESSELNGAPEEMDDHTSDVSRHNTIQRSPKIVQIDETEKSADEILPKTREYFVTNEVIGNNPKYVEQNEIGTAVSQTNEERASRSIIRAEKLERSRLILNSPKISRDLEPEISYPVLPSAIERKNHMIGISGSYGTMSSDLMSKSSGTNGLFTKEYYDKRKSIEKNQDHLDLTIFYKYTFSNSFSLQSGLSYQQYTSKYEGMITNRSTENIIDTIEIYMEGGEIVDAKLGEIPITTTTISRSTNFIKYRMLRIPLLIGYEIHLSNQISMSFVTGTSIGFTRIGKSSLLNPDQAAINYLSFEESGYTKSILLESISQLNFNRNFSNGWVASFGLKYNRDLNNRIGNDMPAEHRFSSFGLRIGVGKRF